MKKKIILIITVLTAIFFISACAAKKSENSVPVAVEPTEAQASSDEPDQTSEPAQNNDVSESGEGYNITEQTIERFNKSKVSSNYWS